MGIIDIALQYWDILSTLVGLAAVGILFYLRKSYVPYTRCEECRKELMERCAGLETGQRSYAEERAAMSGQLANMPRASDLHDIKLAIERLSGDISTVRAELRGQGDMLKTVKNQGDRMNSFLLEKH